jgi:D-ribose pyranase
MKKQGVLQHELAHVIATLGHTDLLVIADAGLPIPSGVQRIDLAVTAGLPGFADVLRAVLGEMQVERAVIAREMRVRSPALHTELLALLGAIPVDEVSHDEFKRLTHPARAVVRTGEFTPYANVILVSGVVF